jgi:multidrug resistance efflux pump
MADFSTPTPTSDVPDGDVPATAPPFYRQPQFVGIAAIVVLALAVIGLRFWIFARDQESTDNGFIEARIVQISPAVSGAVRDVAVSDNQRVKAGDVLMELAGSDVITLRAPESGRVTHTAVEHGALVQSGQPLMTIVTDDVWVVANFKRTQVSEIRPGQPVLIKVRAYPDEVFRGHVDAIDERGRTRSRTLRVPVKIVFDRPPDPVYPLSPGMSVVSTVIVR